MVPVAGLSHRFSRLNAYMSKLIPAKIGYASHIVKVLRRLTSKKETPETDVSDVSLCKDYKKDIFAVFAYEFEILQNRSFLVKSFAYAHGEIIYSVNCEI